MQAGNISRFSDYCVTTGTLKFIMFLNEQYNGESEPVLTTTCLPISVIIVYYMSHWKYTGQSIQASDDSASDDMVTLANSMELSPSCKSHYVTKIVT